MLFDHKDRPHNGGRHKEAVIEWLIVSYMLSVGFMPQNYERMMDSERTLQTDNPASFVQTIGLEAVAFKRLRIWTEIKTYEQALSPLAYSPYRSDYRIGADLLAGPITFSVRHECVHPVISGLHRPLGYQNMQTEFSVRIQGSTRPK